MPTLREFVRRLAGSIGRARPDADLVEWNYGAYEGRRTAEIQAERPGWNVFRDGCPDGESPADVAARATRQRLARALDDRYRPLQGI